MSGRRAIAQIFAAFAAAYAAAWWLIPLIARLPREP